MEVEEMEKPVEVIDVDTSNPPEDMMIKDKDKEKEAKKSAGVASERQLMPNVGTVPIMPAGMADGTALQEMPMQKGMAEGLAMQKGIPMANFAGAKMGMEEEPRKGKRRRIYQTDEERRMARILKNRRTAEESRQRRLHKMKELEAIRDGAQERENKLRWEINELREELSQRVAEINRLNVEMDKVRRENEILKQGGNGESAAANGD
ncbi:hypothetical protein NDN08_000753 [Rhodosorus marinus]|uniref:BZIP domain-containing protein n=1 Tax=Rhodosorus marinus TaxID=101924 RepID=A0AAV8UP62_9RHOD|nr:hypothetical protein NDN08_000753 [Rhodosorus marinus]